MKLQTDIRHWETSEKFNVFTSRHNARQNKKTIQIIIKKKPETKWSNKSSILKSFQKLIKLPSSIQSFSSKIFFKDVLTEFLLD